MQRLQIFNAIKQKEVNKITLNFNKKARTPIKNAKTYYISPKIQKSRLKYDRSKDDVIVKQTINFSKSRFPFKVHKKRGSPKSSSSKKPQFTGYAKETSDFDS